MNSLGLNQIVQLQHQFIDKYKNEYTFQACDINIIDNIVLNTYKIYIIYNNNNVIYDIIKVTSNQFINQDNIIQWQNLINSIFRFNLTDINIKLAYEDILSLEESEQIIKLLKDTYHNNYVINTNNKLTDINQLILEVNNILNLINTKLETNEIHNENNKKKINIKMKNAALKTWQDPEIRKKRLQKLLDKNQQSVKCITTGEVFDSIIAAANYYNVHRVTVLRACTGKTNGFKDKNGKLLQWQYVNTEKQVKQQSFIKNDIYSLYYLYYQKVPKLVIISKLPMNQILPYQKSNKTTPAYKYIQELGYENFSIKCIINNIATRTEAKRLKKQHIQQLSTAVTLYNTNI